MTYEALKKAAACCLAAMLFASPRPAYGASAAIPRPNAAAAEAMAAAIAPSKDDKAAIASGIESLLDFIAGKRGKDAARAISAMRDPSELCALLTSRYGATAYEEALDAFAAWDEEAVGPAWNDDEAERLETEHFVIIAMPGSAAFRDRAYLARFLERILKDMEAIVAPSGTIRALLDRNLEAARTKKIEISLVPGSKAFGRTGSSGEVSYGLTASGQALIPTVSIKTPYYNALTTAPLTSEIAHLIDVYCRFDASGAPPLPEEGLMGSEADRMRQAVAKWAQSSFERIIPYDKGFSEGFAEYVADRACPLRGAFYGGADPLRALSPGRRRPGEDVLDRKLPAADRLSKAVLSVERDSFVSFLAARYGLERLLDFYMNGSPEEKRFKKAYGKGFKAAQAEWRASQGS